jgi:hypothetical protein
VRRRVIDETVSRPLCGRLTGVAAAGSSRLGRAAAADPAAGTAGLLRINHQRHQRSE